MTYLQADRSFGSVANNEILPLACHRSPLAHGRPGAGRPLLAPQQIAFRLKAASTAGSTRQTAVSIPVDYSQLLGLRIRESYLDPQLIHAFEELSHAPLEAGFTKQAEQGRSVILQEAVGELRRRRGRPPFNASQGFLVEWGLLPGTLAVLQEVGEAEVTLEVGKAALGHNKSNPHKRDILLAMSLACCSLASSALSQHDQVTVGCSHLTDAQAYLKQAGQPLLAPELATEIANALHDLQGPATLQLLKAPPSSNSAATRRTALARLKSLLANPLAAAKHDGTPVVDEAFAAEALARLTAPELVNLLDWEGAARNADSIPWAFAGMMKSAAIAHVVTGMVQRRPSLVRTGETLLQASSQNTIVEEVIVKVLLGAPEAATRLLQDTDAALPNRARKPAVDSSDSSSGGGGSGNRHASRLPDPHSLVSWVRAQPDEGEGEQGLLPGLCILTERWMSEIALKQFWVQAEQPPPSSLQAYFQDAKVTSYLATAGEEGESWQGRLGVLADQLSTSLQRLRDPPLSPPSSSSAPLPAKPAGQAAATRPAFRQQQRAVLFAAVLTAAATGALAWQRQLPFQHETLPPVLRSLMRPAGAHSWQSATGMEQQLSAAVAESVIRKWQVAKKASMGPRHDIAALSGAVAEPWLSVVIKDAAAAERSGWFWTYKLDSVQIINVEAGSSKRGGRAAATVTAHLGERGDLWASMGKRVEDASYANPYTVEYKMAYTAEGWRITHTLVLGDA